MIDQRAKQVLAFPACILGLSLGRDIGADGSDSQKASLEIRDRKLDDAPELALAVGGHRFELALVDPPLAEHRRFEAHVIAGEVFGEYVGGRLSDDLCLIEAEIVHERLVDVNETPVRILQVNDHRRVVEDRLQARLALLRGTLGLLQIGDVARIYRDVPDLAALVWRILSNHRPSFSSSKRTGDRVSTTTRK